MKQTTIFFSVIIVLILGSIMTFLVNNKQDNTLSRYDTFAQCLKDKGATFYGAFWCPHCKAEKKLFGTSVHLLPYVECSTSNGSAQTQICIDKKITGYPTWEFIDGSRLTGEVALDKLADKTQCILPQ
ncbi:MAG: hypothetical protein V4439_00545 [Patescibacteria group bacterium]